AFAWRVPTARGRGGHHRGSAKSFPRAAGCRSFSSGSCRSLGRYIARKAVSPIANRVSHLRGSKAKFLPRRIGPIDSATRPNRRDDGASTHLVARRNGATCLFDQGFGDEKAEPHPLLLAVRERRVLVELLTEM